MSAMSKREGGKILVHPRIVRVTHWLNAIAIVIMVGSGWRIYNNVPIFSFIEFPLWATLGGDPDLTYARNGDVGFSNALLWHLAGMWLFMVNGLVYLTYAVLSGRLFRRMLPIRPREFLATIGETLRFKLAHDDITVYNAVQKLLYLGVIAVILAAGALGPRDLEAGAVPGPRWRPVRRFPGRAARAFPGHGGDRRLPRRACGAGVAGSLTLVAMVTGGPRAGTAVPSIRMPAE